MSPNMTSHKSSNIFSSYFWPAAMALIMAIFLSQWAVADPPTESDTQEMITSEEVSPVAIEDPMELPQQAEEDASADVEGSPDAEQFQTTPVLNSVAIAANKLSDKCYEQTDGSFECVCEGEEECKVLETAEHCEAGTHWGKDGYGGCTRISDK